MRIHILTNSIDPADAVSTHCLLLKKHCRDLGHDVHLLAAHAHPSLAGEAESPDTLLPGAAASDLLLYQFFHFSPLSYWADSYAGTRVMMYHNVTPPSLAGSNPHVRLECEAGLRQARALAPAFDSAYGMSEFSRTDLDGLGFAHTGVFPLLIDLKRLRPPAFASPRSPISEGVRFVFLGRLAPNKRQDRLIRMLAAWKQFDPHSTLTLIGDTGQHAAWRAHLSTVIHQSGLTEGEDVIITGKIPDEDVRRILLDSHAFVSASEHEGFGAPLIEAMAFGLPVFAHPAAAVPETLAGAGHLFTSDTESGWAGEIRDILGNSSSRWSLYDAQERRLEDFTIEAQRARVESFLESAAEARRRAAFTPKVSVVINTYNRGWWLDRCLSALETQTYPHFEVIVVNGPSTDSTAEVLERWNGRIKAVQTASRVLSVSRNEGIAAASGDLVAFLDDDAIAEPRWLERLVPAFIDPETGGAGGLVYRMNGRDIEFRCGALDREGFVEWNREDTAADFHWERGRINTVSGNNCIFRRSALEHIGGFDERIEYYHDEADIVWRIERAGFHTVHRPNAVVFHEAARSDNRAGRYSLNWFAIVKNTVYCALKNYTGSKSKPAAALAISRRVVRERMGAIANWRRAGEISAAEAKTYAVRAWRGLAVGLWRGWRRAELLRTFAPASAANFAPFSPSPESAGICLLSQSLPWVRPGGIATYTWELAQGLSRLGCRVHLISSDAPEKAELKSGVWLHRPPDAQLPPGVSLEAGSTVTSKNLASSWAIHRAVTDIHARFGLDVVESPNWDAEGLITAIDRGLPVVVRAHSPLFEVVETQGWINNSDLETAAALERRLAGRATVLTGSTEAILDLVAPEYRLDASRIRRIPLGIDCAPVAEPGSRALDQRPVTVLFAGRLESRKGIDTLFAAIERLLSDGCRARFIIAGEDCAGLGRAFLDRLKWLIPQASNLIELKGRVSSAELDGLFAECDLFAAPSRWESFGLVFLEAMARGKAVIGTTAGGIPEVVENGVTGILVEPGDTLHLAGALQQLINNSSLRESMGAAGLARYEGCFRRSRMAESTLELYSEAANAWATAIKPIYHATATEFQRTPETSIVWSAAHRCLALRSEGSGPRTCVYGPYLAMPAGGWRAQFMLWIDPDQAGEGELARVEAFCGQMGFCESTAIHFADLGPGGGIAANVFFHIDAPMDSFEFRVHACSDAAVHLREIKVTQWPVGLPALTARPESTAAEPAEEVFAE